MPRLIRFTAAPLLVCALLGACTTWRSRPVSQPGAAAFVAKQARVTRADGTILVMTDAHVRGDSLSGTAARGARVAIPLRDVRRVEVRRPNELATAVLATFAAAAVAVLVLVSSRATLAC
jgi:hypothetical protein